MIAPFRTARGVTACIDFPTSLIYKRKDTARDDSIFRTTSGWEMFQCPSMNNGGLPPTNTFPANSDGLPNDVVYVDTKATAQIPCPTEVLDRAADLCALVFTGSGD